MSDTIHPLLDNNMLDFQSISDEKLFLENIEKGNFVMLLVRSRHLERRYKYKMYSPYESTGRFEYKNRLLYTSDIYKKVEHCKNGDL